ncbi:PDZ domain-containing protein [Mangrovibacillus cuniculi]|uniref:PDZ domain-containing protein n=1 Tax=Mangrovibacillus cuniculi TaxID=2593652 RepID=A0A7S8CCJ7_9BACI|nr:PDZ domain-containing protein [Mangrovibacillus cuniculi]QPC47476.1 PDZ domain-containing protein [Mangrovibacillus cuniculi]
MGTVLLELVKGLGYIFIHPLTYVAVAFCVLLGYVRVKQERKHFHVRAHDGWFEFREFFTPISIGAGVILSAVLLLLGPVLPLSWLLVTTSVMLLTVLSFRYEIASMAYVVPFAALMIYTLNQGVISNLPSWLEVSEGTTVYWTALFGLMSILLLVEGILIRSKASKATSPRTIVSKRGQVVGVHHSKRLWFLPLIFLVPTGPISDSTWWPIIHLGETAFHIVGVPLVLGFHKKIKARYAKEAINFIGKQLVALSILAIGLVPVAYFLPVTVPYLFGLIVALRLILQYGHFKIEQTKPFFYTKKMKGLQVLGVVPNSPADKMEIVPGEVLSKVNGIPVKNERELYEAIQKNAAHCKIEVFDLNGEIRKVQRALYEGEHHQLGVFVLEETKSYSNAEVS